MAPATAGRLSMELTPVIGLEVHAQLRTASKLFCACSTTFGATPNHNTCEVCLGMPGVLPVLNGRAVELATRAALALHSTVHARSQWARKNYFYPDLPKGYQVSQYERPLATGGFLAVVADGRRLRVGITRIHMEEDAGKSVHDLGPRSSVDFNRGGVPLIEIVTEPELTGAADAAQALRTLRQILRYLDVCDGNMEEGSLRCDANVSLRPAGTTALGTRTEIKNLNSFRFVEQAITYEIGRQSEVLAAGGQVVQETRLYDAQAKVTRSLRSKEEAHDYRYFPEPDLPDLVLAPGFVDEIARTMPELPAAKRERYVQTLRLSDHDAQLLTEDLAVARYFESALATHANAKAIANWVINDVLREAKGKAVTELLLSPAALGELVALVEGEVVSGKAAKELFSEVMAHGGSPKALAAARGMAQVKDATAIAAWVDQVLAQNPEMVAKYKAGKTNVLGFLVGQVLKESSGAANPKLVSDLLRQKLQ